MWGGDRRGGEGVRRREKCSKGGRKERRNGKKGNDRGKMKGRVREKGGESGRKEGGGVNCLFWSRDSLNCTRASPGTHIFGPSSRKTGYIWISNFIQLNLIRHVKSIKQISTHLTWLDTWKNNNQKSTAKQGIERWSPTDKLRHLNQSVIKII